jgi:hypothetical protein
MNIHTTKNTSIERCRTKIYSKYVLWELRKIFTCIVFCISIIVPINSFWFITSILSLIGSGYFILCETHPQTMLIISILVKYQLRKISRNIEKFVSFSNNLFFLSFRSDYSKVRLKLQNNFNSLVYYDVEVRGKDKQYIYLFNEKLRSNDLIIFKDESDRDITDYIEPYLGPMQDFHGVPVTPNDFNCKRIKVFRDGEICLFKTFEEYEPIKFC